MSSDRECKNLTPTVNQAGHARVGPYVMVTGDKIVDHGKHGKFRVVLYGAFNAMGLIGSECNGILVLNENKVDVVADEIGKEASGYYGPSQNQVEMFNDMTPCSWGAFKTRVNSARRLRYHI